MISKAELRKQLSAERKALGADWIAVASTRLTSNLQQLEAFQAAETIALYKSIPGEVELEPLFEALWKQGKRTCIPVFNAEKNLYDMAEVSAQTQYSTGNYGIQEPCSPKLMANHEINFFTIPGVAFDPAGNRLGRGGGYYDRLLADFSGTAAAVAFDFQILPEVPVDPHDIPVDFIVTETKIINVCNEH